jgi:prepilin-type N-terminal cleavage/methylation domain-containing protein
MVVQAARATRAIFPRPTFDRSKTFDPPPRGRGRGGFTLIEILVAIAVATLMCGALAAGLTRVLASDQAARDFDELALAVRTWGPSAMQREAKPSPLNAGRVRAIIRPWPEGSAKDRAIWERHTLYIADGPQRQVDIWIPLGRVPNQGGS